MSFNEILEETKKLSSKEQILLKNEIDLILKEKNIDQIKKEVEESDLELKEGKLKVQSVDDIMDDLLK
jgi:hypothetical protein